MTLNELRAKIEKGEIDTVIVAIPDVFGRLVGKRFTGKFFLQSVAEHGTHGCNYLLTVNIEMDPLDGFQLANWESGFGDFAMKPDFGSLREIPWQPGAALVICDFVREGAPISKAGGKNLAAPSISGDLVAEAPRSVLRRQIDLLREAGFIGKMASELEFYLFNNSYADAFASGYRNLTASSDYRIDYHTMQPARDEGLFRAVRNMMCAAGVPVESSKGEWGRGQHEVNFVYDEPLEVGDMHVVFKQGIKEIAAQQNRSITFMAKPFMTEAGNSCHIHCSLWKDGANAFWDKNSGGPSKLFRQFLGGLLKYAPELCYFFGPTINSYKRYQPGSWAPTRMAWSNDNRTTGFRVVGSGNGYRIENRMPGADANPYLAFSATLAAGMAGIRENLDCGDDYKGNAYIDEKLRALPSSLQEAIEMLRASKLANEAFGKNVVEFYTHTGDLEVTAYNNSVTDWEKTRYFERI
jgi:glutamine synthetase